MVRLPRLSLQLVVSQVELLAKTMDFLRLHRRQIIQLKLSPFFFYEPVELHHHYRRRHLNQSDYIFALGVYRFRYRNPMTTK